MGRDVRRYHQDRPAGESRDAELVRAAILARLHRRGWPLDRIAEVLGSSKSTVHRRLREMTPAALAELQSADVSTFL